MSVAWTAYRLVAPCLGALAPAARLFASPAERELWQERLGYVSLPEGCHAWLHAASLGEAMAIGPLVRELTALQPDARLYLTATTRTGRTRLLAQGLPASLAPIDSPQAVNRFFAGVRPQRLMVVETELWPHWLMRARAGGVPTAIVSARLSERSVERYRRLGAGLQALVESLDAVLCQTAEDERRWRRLGARPERTRVVGNLKNDALPAATEEREVVRARLGLERAKRLLVLGSVRPGEIRPLARAWRRLPPALRSEWQVVAVPRHPRASAELRGEAAQAGQPVQRDGAVPAPGVWRWDDTVGVLDRYYAAADVAFVGGSLKPYGGHNPLEPAAYGVPVVVGPHHAHQLEAVRALRGRGGAWVVRDERELTEALLGLLGNAEARTTRSEAARATVEAERGAARRAVAALAQWRLWPTG